MKRGCPACPDGNEWNSNGPTGRACPVCKGTALAPGESDDDEIDEVTTDAMLAAREK